jgi:hypothetical protein
MDNNGVLFAKIGFNGETVCEISYTHGSSHFGIYWIKSEYNDILKMKFYNETMTIKTWLESLMIILGYSYIESKSMLMLKPLDIDYIPFDDDEKMDSIPWAGFHNYYPGHVFEIDIIAS